MPAPCEEIIDDIEDLISSQDITPKQRYSSKKAVTIRKRNKIEQDNELKSLLEENDETTSPTNIAQSVIPGTQKIYIKTWGCTHNTSDSEYMAGQLASYGYKIVSEDCKEDADLWLLNSCTVKNPAEDHFRNEIRAAQKNNRPVVVAGCVPQGAPRTEYLQGVSTIGVQQIDRVVEVVEETLKGNSVRLLGSKKSHGKKLGGAPLLLPKVRRNPLVEIIPISTGCLNQCTYCKTKHARGELGSYPPNEIVARARQAFDEGVVEVWLTSEDTGAYGRDINSSLPELLWAVIDTIPDGCMLRLGMTNPPYILEHLPEMAKILAHPRVYSFLHVPVQSASDGVLADMKREYCRADFEKVVTFLRERVPEINIATDIICGFPTESEADFEETLDLCSKFHFTSLFINQFYPRPGTPAARMERVAAAEVKRRTKQLTDLFLSYEPYAGREGQTYKILVTEVSHDNLHYVGHNKSYEQVLVPQRADILGKSIQVRVVETRRHCMIAEIVDTEANPPWADWDMSKVPSHMTSQLAVQEETKGISLLLPCAGLALAVLVRMIWLALGLM